MEFNLSWSFTAIRVDIFNSNCLWNKFDDLYNSVKLVNLNDINYLLLEELD
jgi:hypothetical protein